MTAEVYIHEDNDVAGVYTENDVGASREASATCLSACVKRGVDTVKR